MIALRTTRTKDPPEDIRPWGALSALNSHEGKLLYGAPVARRNNAVSVRLLYVMQNRGICTQ